MIYSSKYSRRRSRFQRAPRAYRSNLETLESRLPLDSTTVINEVMYHPSQVGESEWIELYNQMAVDMDLSKWSLSSAVDFTFPEGTILGGGRHLVIAADPAAFTKATGITSVLGPWSGTLSNQSDNLELRDNNRRLMSWVRYDDGGSWRESGAWPVGADGSGATLAKVDERTGASDDLRNWAASSQVGGTPGRSNVDTGALTPALRFHEQAAPGAGSFWVELTNPGSAPVSMAGSILRSSSNPAFQRVLPDRWLAPGEHYVVETPVPGVDLEPGDRLFLYSASGTHLLDALRINSVAIGRTEDGRGNWQAVDRSTPGSANRFVTRDEIVIHEIQYHQRPTLAVAPTADGQPGVPYSESDEEWIELHNRSQEPVDLSGWKLADGVQYMFPANTRIAGGGYLVVAWDEIGFRTLYPEVPAAPGAFQGSLSNSGERIALLDASGNLADEVHYYQDGRWDANADGHGPSLELIDADADNGRGEAWRASDEGSRSEWRTYTYRGLGDRLNLQEPTVWNEFAFGFLDNAGEALMDDFHVIEDPDGARVELIQNGSFDGGSTAHWRLLGNHQRSAAVRDGDNWVLRVVSDGATEYQGNQIETTFAGNTKLKTGQTYEISFRAKWLNGSRQINSRLYFSRLARTTVLAVPARSGTPGARNSRAADNLGPTYEGLRHEPLVPRPDEPITVHVEATDPDAVQSLVLWYNVNESGWQSVPMRAVAGAPAGRSPYTTQLPGQADGAVVQFYVEGTDGRGARSFFPAAGADSRALVAISNAAEVASPAHNFRLVMTASDNRLLHQPTNSLSNERLGSTVVYQNQVHYDTGVRLKGSFVGRNALRVGFNLGFPEEHKFRGMHGKVSLDRSTHADLGVDEILLKHAANHAGGIPGMYDDLVDLIAPNPVYSGKASLRMAGYDSLYLDTQFENGSDGTIYEYEVIRWPTTTIDGNPESLKRAGGLTDPNGYANIDFKDQGNNKEIYRWTNLILSNRTRDDYDSILALHKAMSATTDLLKDATDKVLDTDQWMRVSAYQMLFGPADANYTGSNIHNFRLYTRPDGKVLYMPWDWDSAFQIAFNGPLTGGGRHARVVRLPANFRNYYGHMLDVIETTFNASYMGRWTSHYGELGGQNFAARLTYIQKRGEFAAARIRRDVPPIDFTITPAEPLVVDTDTAKVTGKGWVNVREIRLAGSREALTVTWTSSGPPVADQWSVQLPVKSGRHTYTLEAFDYQGRSIGRQEVVIESTAPANRLPEFLRLSEIHYNPPGDDGAEFLELAHVGAPGQAPALALQGLQVQTGPASSVRITEPVTLEPGQAVVLARDAQAFLAAWPGLPARVVVAELAGDLANSGDLIRILAPTDETLMEVEYGDASPWPAAADGGGASLQLLRPDVPRDQLGKPGSWQAASPTPGRLAGPAGDFNEDGVVDQRDIDLFFAALRDPRPDARFDLDANGQVDTNDRDLLVRDILHTTYGDTDLDGRFDSQDLVRVFQSAEYEDAPAGNSGWLEGDWNGDGDFTSQDLVLAFQWGGYASGNAAQPDTRRPADIP